ncbi:hypothetical protein [uncultured Methanospirillum sp.]|uniref:hypothetical protein n=1 Tax=uncultured Methanospirillum sp. TaxID=262503 RepID=UPI0029C98BB9|nr:hypothetical protein [uncultured Methanospirillum sp.]
MNQSFSRMPQEREEMRVAISNLLSPSNRYLSRNQLDTEISGSPERYPGLCRLSPRFRRTFITRYMRGRYQARDTSRKDCFVWIVEVP